MKRKIDAWPQAQNRPAVKHAKQPRKTRTSNVGFGSPSLKGKALQWLALREHSRAELQNKLLRHAQKAASLGAAKAPTADGKPSRGPDSDGAVINRGQPSLKLADETVESTDAPVARERNQITQILDDLAAAGLQSDARTAESVARAKSSRYGVHRLKQQLQAKGLSPDLIAHTLNVTRATEYERALALWSRRYGKPAPDPAERMRQARFLVARGFDGDIVRHVVKGLSQTD